MSTADFKLTPTTTDQTPVSLLIPEESGLGPINDTSQKKGYSDARGGAVLPWRLFKTTVRRFSAGRRSGL
jgi:hypothetical protein